jgi:hypothetical protein
MERTDHRAFWTTRIALTAILVALAVALGLLLLAVPNVELITFTIFVSGAVLGRWRGATVGALAWAIFSGVNPYGSGLAFPPLYVAQVLAGALIGLAGGAIGGLWSGSRRGLPAAGGVAAAGGVGFVLTAVYQSGVILGIAVASPEYRTGIMAAIAANAFFSLIHLVSNTVIFAVLTPVVLPRLKRATAGRGIGAALSCLLVCALVLVGTGEAAAADAAAPDPMPGGSALADSTAADALPETPAVGLRPTPGPGFAGDVREIRTDDLGQLVGALPGVRRAGSAWRGHRSSAARGALPPALTNTSAHGMQFDDWIDGGLDLLAASVLSSGGSHVPSGPDLSLWPTYAASSVEVRPDRGQRGSSLLGPGLALDVTPGRPPGSRPFARVSLGTGSYGWNALEAEFGRRFLAEKLGLDVWFDGRQGDAPEPGGGYDIKTAGGRLTYPLPAGWSAELRVLRTELERGLPFPDSSVPEVDRHYVRSEVALGATRGATNAELFHTTSWIGDRRSGHFGTDGEVKRNGARGVLSLGVPWLDRIEWRADHRTASGTLLAGEEALGLACELAGAVDLLPDVRLSLAAGVDYRDPAVIPTGTIAASFTGSRSTGWAGFDMGGRHPTAIEWALLETEVPIEGGGLGEELFVRGNRTLDPEKVLVLYGGYERRDGVFGFGATAEVARVSSPIVLSDFDDGTATPRNGTAETCGSAGLWAALGDSSRPGGRVAIDLFGLDEEGGLNALAPVPSYSVRASAWAPWTILNEFLATRWELLLRHEGGLARGPWDGLVEDTSTAVDAAVLASAGPARVFFSVRDLFETEGLSVPWQPPGEREFALGFSWDFWD